MNSTPSKTPPPENNRDELIRAHLPLAYRLAACYRGSGKRYEALVQSAGVGLVKAAERFDFDSGMAFRTFAAPMITAELGRLLREHEADPRRVSYAQRRISAALSHGHRVRGLAQLLAVDTDVVADALLTAAGRETVTLNLPVQRRGGRLINRLHEVSVTPAAA